MRTRGVFGLLLIFLLVGSTLTAASRAGRRAGKGAAMGAVWGLIIGGDVESAARHAAAGAAMGAASGAIDDAYAKKDAKRAAEAQAAEQARRAEAERQAFEAERRAAGAESRQAAAPETNDAAIEEEWIEAIGEDNWNGLVALVDCQYRRASLLAQAGATVDNEEFKLASVWLEALIVVDQKKTHEAEAYYREIAARDPDVDTVQQASIEVDKAILEIRDYRRNEGIDCSR